MAFVDKLLAAARRNQSWLCVGLDPDPERLPVGDVFAFNRAIVDATADLVCAYKPNLAFYEALGREGLEALRRTVEYIPQAIPTIADAKRADVGHTSRAYARAIFDDLGFDAVTTNPYLGGDSLEPFFERADRGVFVLCKTSNPGAGDFQELPCRRPDGRTQPLYEIVAERVREWNTRGNLGLVVGATYPEQLRTVRSIGPDLPILIPGVGTQAGDLALSVRCGVDARGEKAIINSSRQVLYASSGQDFALAARRVARDLRDSINRYMEEALDRG